MPHTLPNPWFVSGCYFTNNHSSVQSISFNNKKTPQQYCNTQTNKYGFEIITWDTIYCKLAISISISNLSFFCRKAIFRFLNQSIHNFLHSYPISFLNPFFFQEISIYLSSCRSILASISNKAIQLKNSIVHWHHHQWVRMDNSISSKSILSLSPMYSNMFF